MTQMIGQKSIGIEIDETLLWEMHPIPIWKLVYKCMECIDEDERHYLLNYLLTWKIREKEIFCTNLILKKIKHADEITIIGSKFPANYVFNLGKAYDCKFNLIDFHPCFERWSSTILNFADCEYYKMRPLFDDLNSIIENSNLIIFPETEFLIPFKHLNYDLSNKNVLYVNQQLNVDRINDNIVNSELEMEQMCNVSSSIKGKINSTSYYLLKLT